MPFTNYIIAKHNHETLYDSYMLDCLWAMATNRRFKDYPRWHELNTPTKQVKPDTGADILLDIINAW